MATQAGVKGKWSDAQCHQPHPYICGLQTAVTCEQKCAAAAIPTAASNSSRRLTDCVLARCEAHYGLGTANACACAFGCSNADAGFQRCQRQCDYQVPTPARPRRDRCQLSAPPLQCDGTAECSCGCSSCDTCTALPGSDDPNSCADPCNAGCLMA